MCLTLKFRTRQLAREGKKPLIAKEDITVYKGLEYRNKNEYLSPHRYFIFAKGDHLYQKSKGKNDPIFKISGIRNRYDDWAFSISIGLHSCSSKKEAAKHGSRQFKMIIPKGSKYYTDGNLYVSDNLIFPY